MRAITLTLLSTTLVAALAACKQDAAAPVDGAASPPPSAPEASAPAGSAKEAFRRNMQAFAQARSYHATMTMAGGPMGEMKTEMDFVAPDRFRTTMNMAGQPIEVIMIGGDSYMKMGGQWMKNPGPGQQDTPKWDQELAKHLDSAQVQDLGKETVNGVQARKYRVTLTHPAPADTTTWFGQDGLPVQVVTSVPSAGQTMTSTIVYSRYNDPAISIQAPL